MTTKVMRCIVAGFLAAVGSRTEAGVFQGDGGTVLQDGEYIVHVFTNSGTFKLSKTVTADILVVGGGGGGGAAQQGGGGGGGGGVVYRQAVSLSADKYDIVVGQGGAGGYAKGNSAGDEIVHAQNGETSIAFGLNAVGGGAGGGGAKIISSGTSADKTQGWDGASGGGGAGRRIPSTAESIAGGSVVEGGNGYAGGASTNGAASVSQGYNHCWAGGGGGAGGPGGSGICTADAGTAAKTTGVAGDGGVGLPCGITGAEVLYGGGGGGGQACYQYASESGTAGKGGIDGGGAGSGNSSTDAYSGLAGVDGCGGGGGGGGGFGTAVADGGKGGCGVVIVRYRGEWGEYFKTASGGTLSRDGRYRVFTFVTNGTFSVEGCSRADILVVGGGGGGGAYAGGGGGAGGFVYRQSVPIITGTYDVHVGCGGAGGVATVTADGKFSSAIAAGNGEESSAFGIVATGGGAGGSGGGSGSVGLDGATGGGGGANKYCTTGEFPGGVSTNGQGCAGGKSITEGTHWFALAGGGGGAKAAGGDAVYVPGDTQFDDSPGNGGDGLTCSITGKDVVYAGGGAGGNALSGRGYVGQGGDGGGGDGGGNVNATPQKGVDGEPNTGGGGGGGGRYTNKPADGGKGGSGIVIVRCRLEPNGLMLLVR